MQAFIIFRNSRITFCWRRGQLDPFGWRFGRCRCSAARSDSGHGMTGSSDKTSSLHTPSCGPRNVEPINGSYIPHHLPQTRTQPHRVCLPRKPTKSQPSLFPKYTCCLEVRAQVDKIRRRIDPDRSQYPQRKACSCSRHLIGQYSHHKRSILFGCQYTRYGKLARQSATGSE